MLAAKEFRSPVQIFEKASFFHIRSSNVYLVAATRENVNASMVFQFLFALVGVFKGYFGGTFEEDTVRDNFPLVYELLDEVMDFGYPQVRANLCIHFKWKHPHDVAANTRSIAGDTRTRKRSFFSRNVRVCLHVNMSIDG